MIHIPDMGSFVYGLAAGFLITSLVFVIVMFASEIKRKPKDEKNGP